MHNDKLTRPRDDPAQNRKTLCGRVERLVGVARQGPPNRTGGRLFDPTFKPLQAPKKRVRRRPPAQETPVQAKTGG